MADNSFRIETVGLDEMHDDFKRMSLPKPPKDLRKVELLFDAAFAATESRVHVDTGALKLSGHHDTHYVADAWTGEITYRRHPGVFELARANTPTRTHPEGGHDMFDAAEVFVPHMENAITDIFDEYFGV